MRENMSDQIHAQANWGECERIAERFIGDLGKKIPFCECSNRNKCEMVLESLF